MKYSPGAARPSRVAPGLLLAALVHLPGCSGDPSDPPGTGREFAGVREMFRVAIPPGAAPVEGFALDGERIYFDLAGGAGVVAHDRFTGQRIWTYARPPGGPSNVVLHGGLVLFVGDLAIAVDAADGSERWRFDPGAHGGLGTTAAAGDAYYFGTDRHLFALAVEDGAPLWSVDLGDDSWTHRSIVRGVSVGGDTVYANVERYLTVNGEINYAYVFALDRHTGEGLWTFREGEGSSRHFFWGGPRVAGSSLLLADFDTNVYLALDRMIGEVRWRTPGDPGGYFGAGEAPWVSGDTVYGASADRWVTAMDLATGDVHWQSRVPGSAFSLALCGARVLVTDGGLEILDRRTGEFLTTYDDGPHTIHSGFAVDDGHAYVLGSAFAYGFRCPD